MNTRTKPPSTHAPAVESKPRAPAAAKPDKKGVASLRGGDYLSLGDLDAVQIRDIFETAAAAKADITSYRDALRGKTAILLFEKPSLRTRVTFEVGPVKMGGHALYFDHSKDRIGARESVKDYAKNLERWVDCIVARVFDHRVLEELAAHARIPVVNALSDRFHPCQALADYFTLAERARGAAGLRGFRLAFIGDGNNVCASLMHGAGKLGVHLTIVCPPGYEPEPAIVQESRGFAAGSGGSISITHDPDAVKGVQAVYTDTWVSMGDEAETAARANAFRPYRVDERLMALAAKGASFMHCLPAHRGEEVTDAVIDSKASIVYDQAENRMHVQNGLLLHLLGGA
jgi:ornithine carbamoyltransferase